MWPSFAIYVVKNIQNHFNTIQKRKADPLLKSRGPKFFGDMEAAFYEKCEYLLTVIAEYQAFLMKEKIIVEKREIIFEIMGRVHPDYINLKDSPPMKEVEKQLKGKNLSCETIMELFIHVSLILCTCLCWKLPNIAIIEKSFEEIISFPNKFIKLE